MKNINWGVLLFFVVWSLGFAGGGVYVAYTSVMRPMQMKSWHETDAMILAREKMRDDVIFESGKRETPKIKYKYEVGNQPYIGNEFGKPLEKYSAEAHAFNADYAPGKKVRAYYNPKDAEDVVLIRPTVTLGAMLISPIFIVTGLFVLGYFGIYKNVICALQNPKKKRKKKRPKAVDKNEERPTNFFTQPYRNYPVWSWIVGFVFVSIFPTVFVFIFGASYVERSTAKSWTPSVATVLETYEDGVKDPQTVVLAMHTVDSQKYGFAMRPTHITVHIDGMDVSNHPTFHTGDTFAIAYNPENPKEVYSGFSGHGIFIVIVMFVFFVILPYGILAYHFVKNRPRGPANSTGKKRNAATTPSQPSILDHIQDGIKNIADDILTEPVKKNTKRAMHIGKVAFIVLGVIKALVIAFIFIGVAVLELFPSFEDFAQLSYVPVRAQIIIAMSKDSGPQFMAQYSVDSKIYTKKWTTPEDEFSKVDPDSDWTTVYYDAENPQKSVYQKPTSLIWVRIIFAIVFCIVPLIVVVRMCREIKNYRFDAP